MAESKKKEDKPIEVPSYEWWTLNETADYMRRSPKTIRNLLSKDKFPIRARKALGRILFNRDEVKAYMKSL